MLSYNVIIIFTRVSHDLEKMKLMRSFMCTWQTLDPTRSVFGVPAGMIPLEFLQDFWCEKTGVHRLP